MRSIMRGESNGADRIKQLCEVCDEEGIFSPGRILIIGTPIKYEAPVGQCPTCERFFCARHAEGIPDKLNREELSEFCDLLKTVGQKPRLLCCPLDLGVPLGDPDERRAVFVSSDVERLSAELDATRQEKLKKLRGFPSWLKGAVRSKRSMD